MKDVMVATVLVLATLVVVTLVQACNDMGILR